MEQPHEERSTVRKSREQLETKARELKEDVKSTAEEQVSRGKAEASGKAHAIAGALRDAGASLDQQGERELARWGRQSADQVERMASYLDRNDLSGLVQDLEGTARSNAGAFVGGTFAAGLLLGRFLRSSSPEPEQGTEEGATAMVAGGATPRTMTTPPSMSGPSALPATPARERIRVRPATDEHESFGTPSATGSGWKETTHE